MCGIAGIYSRNGFLPPMAVKMSEKLSHRGPDDEGFLFVDFDNKCEFLKGGSTIKELSGLSLAENYGKKARLGLIHRRLSIIDLKPTGHQPMSYVSGDVHIVFNGEIYNYIEIKEELIKQGYHFVTESDTEVIIASYLHWGEKCVDHFIGMWSFVILDHKNRLLFCSRDRFGIKPFYYFKEDGIFIFASEVKAILVYEGITPKLDKSNAIEFLINGNQYFRGKTFFDNICQLPPGHNLVYDLDNNQVIIKEFYSIPSREELSKIGICDAIYEFDRLVDDAIRLHLRADVPIGSSLSGGLDSANIVARLVKKNLPYKVNTFTASFPGHSIDESHYVRKLKEKYDIIDHYTFPDPIKLWQEADKFLWHQEMPLQSTSPFAQWEVMNMAKECSIKVLLDGQGMDEILGGYSEFVGAYLLGLFTGGRLLKAFKSIKDLKSNYKTSSISNELGRSIFQYLPQFLKTNIYSSRRLAPSMINTKYRNLSREVKFERRISNSIRETSIMSINNNLPVLLRYEDRNSMAFSIESRVPYLDHRLVEFCVNIPDDYKVRSGWTKYILRKTSQPFLSDEITWRKTKLGFVTPEKHWLGIVHWELRSLMEQKDIPNIIDKDALIKVLNSDIDKQLDLAELWKIILFIRWFNLFNLKND
jgi:asparagine synthase (glutamine-hydrolysing)